MSLFEAFLPCTSEETDHLLH